jgi:UDP-2,4-diacetamido-2,4,6-trideoxy-beta-L-altropyranose hydrolase
MRVVFRVDASLEMGSGHLMRCLTLADEIKARGHECHFISRQQPGDLIELVKEKGFTAHVLPECDVTGQGGLSHSNWLKGGQQQDFCDTEAMIKTLLPDWLIVDHYGIDANWEQLARIYAKRILVIDDLADRQHDCEVLLDQNLGQSDEKYRHLTPPGTTLLTGADYALLRPEFAQHREESLTARYNNTQIDHILVTMGGVDKDNVTAKVLSALEKSALRAQTQVTVVLGTQAPWLSKVKMQAEKSRLNTQVLSGVNNMAELMSQSDLAIGAAGSTSWERCFLGLPTIVCVLADNQQEIANALQESKAAVTVLGDNIRAQITEAVNRFLVDPETLKFMADKASYIVDGKGVNRVVERLENSL